MLTSDHMLVVEALQKSHIVEISPDNEMVRPCGCFNQWILPFQQKNATHIYSQTVGSAVNTVESTNEIPSVSKGPKEDDALSLVEVQSDSAVTQLDCSDSGFFLTINNSFCLIPLEDIEKEDNRVQKFIAVEHRAW